MTQKEVADLAGLVFVVLGIVTAAAGYVAWYTGKESADANALALSQQQEKTANAMRAVIELQEQARPRELSHRQRSRLLELLAGQPREAVGVTSALGDWEGRALAEQIADVLKEAGWLADGSPGQGSWRPATVGLELAMSRTSPATDRLQRAFREVGMPLPGLRIIGPEQQADIRVGAKPGTVALP